MMEKLKAKDIFNKVKKFNELSEYLYQGDKKLTVTFEEEDGTTHDFDSYRDFAKFIRQIYISEAAEVMLENEWYHDGEYFWIRYGLARIEYELYVHAK